MKIHLHPWSIALLAVVIFLAFSSASRAQVYTEASDAGNTLATAQSTISTATPAGTAITTIAGSIGTGTDADLYLVYIASPSTFSATTNNSRTNTSFNGTLPLDTSLFLFDASGHLLAANDDINGTTVTSTLAAGNPLYASLAAGYYYIGISISGNDPVNLASQLLPAKSDDSTDTLGVESANNLNPTVLSTFNQDNYDNETGAYGITLTGVNAAPEPSAWACMVCGGLVAGGVWMRRRKLRRACATVCAGCLLLAGTVRAGQVPGNLGSGLDALVQANVKLNNATQNGTAGQITLYNGYATEKAANVAPLAISDSANRILVRVQLNGIVSFKRVAKKAARKVPSLQMQASDPTYHGAGVFEAWVTLDDVPKLAALEGISGVFLTPKPIHARLHRQLAAAQPAAVPSPTPYATSGEVLKEIGTVFDFGVTQHAVDQINKTYNPNATLDYEGRGISIGDLSDSYNTKSMPTTTAPTDVTNQDLPGSTAAGAVNPLPVVVLQDFPGGTDEGRGMIQTLFKMAPKARLAFATADFGELQFADNIRNLAGVANPDGTVAPTPSPVPATPFKADIIVDDVSYLDEPFFQDGIIAQGVNDVVAAGVSYFSSAANNPGTNGYDSDFRFVTNGTGTTSTTNSALVGTNINLANVPTTAYAAGFHNFNPNGLDVAQTVNFPNAVVLANYGNVVIPGQESGLPVVLQWNDPDNVTTPSLTGTFATFTGTANAATSQLPEGTTPVADDSGNTFPVTLTAGQEYYLQLVPSATPTVPGTNALDGQIEVYDAAGNELTFVDNNGSGANEYAIFFAPATATYNLRVTAFQSAAAMDVTDGSYTLTVYTANGTDHVTENLNLLVFDMNGNYIAADSVTTNGIDTASPVKFVEFAAPANQTQVQFVIGRSTPAASDNGRRADHFRYLCFGDGIVPLGPAEYFSYTTPLTFGHSSAAGANSVAAYPYYKPNIPEYFTSPGPSTVYFDSNNNYIGKTVRLKPDVAAMDGANTSFFGSDDSQDTDSSDNFFGTSDAAPHAAAIAALVLEANGGSGKVTPAQMKSVLQRSAFPHDLDPYYAKGQARTTDGGKVTIIVKGDDEDSTLTTSFANGTTGIRDPNAITVKYIGPGYLTSLVLNGVAANVTDGTNGLTTPASGQSTYFSLSTPGVVFDTGDEPFTLGTSSSSLTTATVTSSVSADKFTLTLTFSAGAFVGGDDLRFTIGRDEYEGATSPPAAGGTVTNGSADIIGGGVSIPDGAINTQVGMTFSGTTSTGATFGSTSPGLTGQTATIRNRIGAGYSALDGYGFINARTAVTLPLQ